MAQQPAVWPHMDIFARREVAASGRYITVEMLAEIPVPA